MNLCLFSKRGFFSFFSIYILIVISLIYYTPFTKIEEDILKETLYISNYLSSLSFQIFQDKLSIRLPFFIISLGSIYLMKKISEFFIKREEFLYLALFIFLITPGFFVSTIIVNYATISIFLALLLVYSFLKENNILTITILVLLFFTKSAHFSIYIAISIYSFLNSRWRLFSLSIILLILSLINANYPINGIPKGHLQTLLGTYAVTFSPFYFLSIIYILYRGWLDKSKNIVWYIAFVAFSISLLLSIRQKVNVTDFTPFLIPITPLVIYSFQKALLIRLPSFRKNYYRLCKIVVIVLLLETFLIAIDYSIYKLINRDLKIIDKSIYKTKILTKNG